MKLKKLNKIKLHTMTTLYGAPGSGKSSFINTLPGSVLIIDTDRGLASVEQDERFSVAECTSWADVLEALTYAKDFDSIAVDHFTNVQELCYKDIMETNNAVSYTHLDVYKRQELDSHNYISLDKLHRHDRQSRIPLTEDLIKNSELAWAWQFATELEEENANEC